MNAIAIILALVGYIQCAKLNHLEYLPPSGRVPIITGAYDDSLSAPPPPSPENTVPSKDQQLALSEPQPETAATPTIGLAQRNGHFDQNKHAITNADQVNNFQSNNNHFNTDTPLLENTTDTELRPVGSQFAGQFTNKANNSTNPNEENKNSEVNEVNQEGNISSDFSLKTRIDNDGETAKQNPFNIGKPSSGYQSGVPITPEKSSQSFSNLKSTFNTGLVNNQYGGQENRFDETPQKKYNGYNGNGKGDGKTGSNGFRTQAEPAQDSSNAAANDVPKCNDGSPSSSVSCGPNIPQPPKDSQKPFSSAPYQYNPPSRPFPRPTSNDGNGKTGTNGFQVQQESVQNAPSNTYRCNEASAFSPSSCDQNPLPFSKSNQNSFSSTPYQHNSPLRPFHHNGGNENLKSSDIQTQQQPLSQNPSNGEPSDASRCNNGSACDPNPTPFSRNNQNSFHSGPYQYKQPSKPFHQPARNGGYNGNYNNGNFNKFQEHNNGGQFVQPLDRNGGYVY